jgi:hypothetical protein
LIHSQSHAQLVQTYSISEGVEDISFKEVKELGRRERGKYSKILDCFGKGVKESVEGVEKRFREDWKEVQDLWVRLFPFVRAETFTKETD